jgi:hypothetical protein
MIIKKHDIRKEVWKIINAYFENQIDGNTMSIVVQAYHINKAINIAIDETIRLHDKKQR